MNRIKNKYINTKNNFITIEKEATKSEKFYIKSYKIN